MRKEHIYLVKGCYGQSCFMTKKQYLDLIERGVQLDVIKRMVLQGADKYGKKTKI